MKLIGPFTQLLTMDHLNLSGPIRDKDMPLIHEGGVLVENGIIVKVGKYQDLIKGIEEESLEIIDGIKTALPGMIDAHTHICFGGSRARDYSMRIEGESYESVLAGGGGIWDTVLKTRESSYADLKNNLQKRAIRHFREGVTTIEVKSGYGLNVQHELRMLRMIRESDTELPVDLIPTCLAAHVVPGEFEDEKKYLDYISGELFPEIRKENLCNRVDIFIEKNAFSIPASEQYLKTSTENGFGITIHADQFTVGGSYLASRFNAQSADHLEASGDKEIRILSKSGIPAVVLPGSCLGLGLPFAKARSMLDAGCILVIASDWNPGSAPMGDLLLQASLISVYEKLSAAETFAAITFRAAMALQMNDRGKIAEKNLCDIIAFDTADYRDILYHQGKLKPSRLWKKGQNFTLPK
jgi:imidazolonepropionase